MMGNRISKKCHALMVSRSIPVDLCEMVLDWDALLLEGKAPKRGKR